MNPTQINPAQLGLSLAPPHELAQGELWMAYTCALTILLCLILYTLTAGADFGGGALSLFAPREPRLKRAWRDAVDEAIAPVWESNHVWLIVAIVVLFVCFPTAFSWISIGLHLPLALLLVGVSLRGAAFVFAHYDPHGLSEGWRRVFRISSALTPLSLGLVVGALAGGGLGEALAPLVQPNGGDEISASLWWSAWLNPFAFAVALMTLTLFMWLAAVYLFYEVSARLTRGYNDPSVSDEELGLQEALKESLRWRAYFTQAALAFSAALALYLAQDERVVERLVWSNMAPAFHLLVAISALGALWGLFKDCPSLARAFGALQAVAIVAGWGASSLPFIIPELLTVSEGAAPASTLKATLICVAIALALVLPATAWLFYTFKVKEPQD